MELSLPTKQSRQPVAGELRATRAASFPSTQMRCGVFTPCLLGRLVPAYRRSSIAPGALRASPLGRSPPLGAWVTSRQRPVEVG